jgi:predicted ATP-dependent endonuclease of OLD family
MRLVKLTLAGYRRFEKADVHFDSDVLAFIGPNEAGKSTLFSALASLDTSKPIPRADWTRGLEPTPVLEQVCLEAHYLLDKGEMERAASLGSQVAPRWYTWSKKFNGEFIHGLEPRPERDRRPREAVVASIEKTLGSKQLRKTLQRVSSAENDEDDTGIVDPLLSLAESLEDSGETLEEELLERLQSATAALRDTADRLPPRAGKAVSKLLDLLVSLSEHEAPPHPNNIMLKEMEKRRPKAFLFTDEDRQLSAEYSLSALEDPPAALQNLLDLAEVKAADLESVVDSGDHAHRAGIQQQINERLREKFSASWQQSAVYPFLHFEPDVLRVHVSARDTYTPISERSEGLRTFVALWAFVALRQDGPPPILLVDEAESHLHYDAQADLVRMFYRQNAASQLFYSTHSAGCLPHDLGTGIRVVRPVYDDIGNDTGRSEVKKSFWTDSRPGFSPLMFAIGAGTFAIVPTRKAVLTEGASDCVLLPTLLREAMDLPQLDFQIAPGLASVSPNDVPELDLEAPRVVFVLDGDAGGDQIAAKLTRGGVQDWQILRLEKGLVIEDYIDASVYVDAVNEEVRRSNGDGYVLTLGNLSDTDRPSCVACWCEQQGIRVPPKVAVAERALGTRGERLLLSERRTKSLTKLYKEITEALMSRFDRQKNVPPLRTNGHRS